MSKSSLVKHLLASGVEAAEYGAASFAFGYVQNRYREKASVMGVPADLLAGVVLKGASLFTRGRLSTHADLLGNAGIGAFFHTLGSGYGAEKSGMTRLLINKADVAKAKAALPGATILGDISKAPHGAALSAADLRAMAE